MVSNFEFICHFNSSSRTIPRFLSLLQLLKPIKNPNKTLKIMSWACSSCTFLNPPSQKSNCQICLTPFSSSISSSSSSSSSSPHKWACKACTFLNSYSNSNCKICDTRNSLSSLSNFVDLDPVDDLDGSSVGSVFFPLRRCSKPTTDDPDGARDLGGKEMFDDGSGLNSGSSKRKFRDPISVNSSGVNDFGGEKRAKTEEATKASSSVEISEDTEDKKSSDELKILTYNVWFREDLEVHRRMQEIGNLIRLHSPDVICFQEVTPNIYSILLQSIWWKKYQCSVSYERVASETYFCMQLAKLPVKSFNCKPFSYTAMGRELCITEIELTGEKSKSLVIATSHLESPCPGPPKWDQMYSKERVNQAKEAISFLQKYPNVVFCGDMNWDDKLDGRFPLVEEEGEGLWVDAWEKMRPGEIGFTYDTKSNKMLTGNRTLQKRLDRFICHLPDFKIKRVEMIGTEPIPGLTYTKQKKMKNKIQELTLPVFPSDHFGLLLTISSS